MFLFYLVFALSLCASVYMCFVVTCWERADLLALICGVCCEFVTFPLVSWVRCGTWLYRFLIFAPLLTLTFEEITFGSDHYVSLTHVCISVSFVCFVALRPKSTAMVMVGWSVHLTTLFLVQA